MDKVLLCRLCLANSGTVSFVSSTPDVEIILQKFNILFEVKSVTSKLCLNPIDFKPIAVSYCCK